MILFSNNLLVAGPESRLQELRHSLDSSIHDLTANSRQDKLLVHATVVRIVNGGRQIVLSAGSHIPRLARVRHAANAVQKCQIYCLKVRV